MLPILALSTSSAFGGLITKQWYHGSWDCNIDGRPAKMVWQVVNDPQTSCHGDICSTTSGVKTIGWFSDNGAPWVRLGINPGTNGNRLKIRYMGQEPDNWYLDFVSHNTTAVGKTTWRGKQYPLSCWNRH
ncbi:DUF6006 family protein [Oligoflexus tunisiensis]|uniref:DUF6006 family protein n=1 Tax=Oligoflexus tunisiensis TaxID=708132 RepID=UPI001C40299C|nr:DUF6006 family protein [Oligoflexus tunisiensis]